MIDLKNASRDDLIRLIVSQHETITRQERMIAAQQERIATLEATGTRLTARVDDVLATVETLRRGDAGTGMMSQRRVGENDDAATVIRSLWGVSALMTTEEHMANNSAQSGAQRRDREAA